MRISWKLWKLSFPYICENCGKLHYYKAACCEFCGKENTLREVIKKDYKVQKLMGK